MWISNGYSGCAYYGNLYGTYLSLPVVLLDVNEVNL